MLYIFLLLIGLIILNLSASRSIRRGADTRYKQNMLIAMIWLVPFIGLFMATGHITQHAPTARKHEPLQGTVDGSAPMIVRVAGCPDFDVQRQLVEVHGFPVISADAFDHWLAASPQASTADMACVAKAWLMHMREACGPEFRLFETEHAFILSPLESGVLRATGIFMATTRRRITAVLRDLAVFPAGSKSVLLVLHDEDAYYQYVSAYYPDNGEFSFSSGMFINSSVPHFVVPLAELAAIEAVIAHEMTHSALSHLTLPRWLDEGLAVNTEQRLTGVPRLIYTPHELHEKHLRYWGTAEMQQFWTGESFFRTDDGNLLSYELARILVSHLSADWDRFTRFVTHAQREDGGGLAAREHMNVELGALVCALLEQPFSADWEPVAVSHVQAACAHAS
ncbi:hypothetical protein G4G28_05090 [Massilia sp. Dwa41.01b]|uniref:hypothetical protein n=1 Tax=unclassified Massilia TaxID=2609279 RepID=UPI001600D662|nr:MULTISPECIES: hypothetical protein [unclassified Massilia]QNA88010.1 hypothetical protein G4G28_05090 [Massilia sp. Dwa41.01b]QNA98912.1 hypothetical protein G4G31_08805 [Massilia sp. Se16.2.3]